jgi:hypothetical protein
MNGSANFSPMLFVLAIVLILVWQALGHIGPEYYFLHLIGRPWRAPPVVAASPRALMVWADDGGKGERAPGV